jgi:MFS family permease
MIPVAFMIGFTTAILCTNVVPHVSDVGFSPLYAAGLSSICFGALAAGKIVLGKMVDALGVQRACFLSCVAILLGSLGMYLAAHRAFHSLIVLGDFLGGPCGTVSWPLLAQAIFGKKAYVEVNGVLSSMNFCGAAVAPFAANLIYDATGSYNGVFVICIVMAVLAGTFYLTLRPAFRPERAG